MKKQIYALLKSYDKKELDDNFINEAFNLMMKEININDYVSDFRIDNKISNLGSYSNMEQEIRINKDKIIARFTKNTN